MDENAGINAIRRIHGSEEFVPLVLHWWDIFMIFQSCTLTLTHPEQTETNITYYTQLAKQLEVRLSEEFPELVPLMTMCWHRGGAVSVDDDIKRKLRKRYR